MESGRRSGRRGRVRRGAVRAARSLSCTLMVSHEADYCEPCNIAAPPHKSEACSEAGLAGQQLQRVRSPLN